MKILSWLCLCARRVKSEWDKYIYFPLFSTQTHTLYRRKCIFHDAQTPFLASTTCRKCFRYRFSTLYVVTLTKHVVNVMIILLFVFFTWDLVNIHGWCMWYVIPLEDMVGLLYEECPKLGSVNFLVLMIYQKITKTLVQPSFELLQFSAQTLDPSCKEFLINVSHNFNWRYVYLNTHT